MSCGIKGCDLPVLALGLCNKHYQRNRKYGSPMALKSHSGAMHGLSAEERFSRQMKMGAEGECWLWAAATDKDGYGRFRGVYMGVSHTKAHRFSWSLHNRKVIPEGMLICHSCDNPRCVHPDHLSLGTPLDNMLDKIAKGRHNAPKGALAPAAVISEEQAVQILGDPRPYAQIAADYGIAASTVGSIKNKTSWSHLDVESVKSKRVSPRKGKGSKLTESDVREIRESAEPGVRLAEKYQVSPQMICNIKARRVWAHIP